MADRTVKVNLTAAVSGYINNFNLAETATRKFANAAAEAKFKLEQHNQAMTKLGVGFLAAGAVAAAGLALVIKASTEYGAKMAQLQSLSHASADEMKALSDAAMTQGQAFGFTASQVADAEIELTKAGVSVKDQLGGALKGALELAAAGQIDVGQATEYATVAMTQFGLKAGDVPHLADLMAAGADKALGSVGDLGEALKNGGLQAHNMGLSIDDTIGLLSAFANAGIIGAEAGTQMRSMFIQLQRPTAAAKKTLDEYGISLSDSKGRFVGITALAGELHDKLGGLTQAQRNAALATIFGSHAISGATVLYQDGAKGIAGWIKAVNDTGFASAQAAGKLNSLQGDLQKLSAAVQTDLIKLGSSASGALRGIVQDVTGVVNAFGDLPQPVQAGVVIVTTLVAGVGLLGGTMLIAIPKIAAFKFALADLGTTGRGLAGVLGKGGVVLAGLLDIGLAFTALGEHGTASSQQIEQAALTIQSSWKGVDKLFGSAGSALDSGKGLKASIDELGNGSAFSSAGSAKIFDQLTFGIAHLSDVYKANEGTFDAMGQQLAGLAKQDYGKASSSFASLTRQFHLNGDEVKNLLNNMPAYKEELIALAQKAHVQATDQNLVNIAMGKGAAGAKVLAQAQKDAAAASADAASSAKTEQQAEQGLTAAIKQVYDARQKLSTQEEDAIGTDLAAKDAIQATSDALKASAQASKNGTAAWGDNTTAGRKNEEQVLSSIKTIQAHAAVIDSDGKHSLQAARYTDTMGVSLVQTMEQFGVSKKAAEAYVGKLLGIPKNVTTEAQLHADQAEAKLADIRSKMNNLNGYTADIYINAVMSGVDSSRASQIARNAGFAAGGAVGGRGPKGVDSVPAFLAPGEHVWTDREVDAVGGQAAMYRMRAAARTGRLQRYAGGGEVRSYSGAGGNWGGGGMMFPTHVALLDENGGLITTARVVANQQIAQHSRAQRLTIPR